MNTDNGQRYEGELKIAIDLARAAGAAILAQYKKPVSYTHLTLPTICSV